MLSRILTIFLVRCRKVVQNLGEGKMNVKVLKINDTWYGMTYHEDVVAVKDSFKKMLADGVYKADLFSDL